MNCLHCIFKSYDCQSGIYYCVSQGKIIATNEGIIDTTLCDKHIAIKQELVMDKIDEEPIF